MKRIGIICVLFLLTCPLAVFAAGGKEATSAAGPAASAPGVFPIVAEKVNLTFFAIQDPRVENLDTNTFTSYVEKKTNVHINWQLVPEAGVDEKRKLLLASGDFPDVLYGAQVTPDELVTFGANGSFIALNDLIQKQAVELKKIFTKYPTTRGEITAPDGRIYSMPYINQCYHCSLSEKMWINRQWLSALGLKMPTTTDEFYNTLVAFRDRDPNMNGKKDEVPLSGAIKSWNSRPDDFLMNAFIYNDGTNRLVIRDGTVDFAANKAAWREGLRYMHKLYSEGLLDPASFTQDATGLQRLGENPDVILGAAGGGWPGNFIQWNAPTMRSKMYDILAPLKGPAGNQTTTYYSQAPGVSNFVITKVCKYPEVAVKWADQFLSYEMGAMLNYGRQGSEWDWAKTGDVGLNGKPAVWKQLNALQNPQNVTWYMWGIFNYDSEWRLGQATPQGADPFDPANLELLLFQGSKRYEPYAPREYMPNLWMSKDVSNEVAKLGTAIQTYVDESTAQFVVGDKDIEKDWDAYVAEFNKMDLARFLQLYQQEYSTFMKK